MIRIPKELKQEIKNQIIQNSAKGEEGWRFSKKEEDSLLGDYLGNLRTDKRFFTTIDKKFEWEILYHKMQGRGQNAYEKYIGADAIITFEIKSSFTRKRTVKSLIFQAKKEGNTSGIDTQKSQMDKIAKGGNFIFTCGSNGYFAQTEIGGLKQNIGQFLAHRFIECKIGLENFEYDEVRELLKYNNRFIEKVKLDEVIVKVEIDNK